MRPCSRCGCGSCQSRRFMGLALASLGSAADFNSMQSKETGGMRRVHLRGHTNIRKRRLIDAGGFNVGLVVRRLIGVGKPRALQRRFALAVGPLCGADSRGSRAIAVVPTPGRRLKTMSIAGECVL